MNEQIRAFILAKQANPDYVVKWPEVDDLYGSFVYRYGDTLPEVDVAARSGMTAWLGRKYCIDGSDVNG